MRRYIVAELILMLSFAACAADQTTALPAAEVVPVLIPATQERDLALIVAVAKNDLESARKLLAEGANPNVYSAQNYFQYMHNLEGGILSPLHVAAGAKNLDMLRLLLDGGAAVTAVGTAQETGLKGVRESVCVGNISPLLFAADSLGGSQVVDDDPALYAVLQFLLARGARPDDRAFIYPFSQAETGESCMQPPSTPPNPDWIGPMDVLFTNYTFAELLLRHGAKIRPKTLPDYVNISDAPSAKNVALYLQYGASVDERDEDGKTALDYAKERGLDDIVKLLQK
jgi:ankyrin repeat protein